MEGNRLFSNARCMMEQIERFDQLVSGKLVLTAKTIGIRALLNFGVFERGGDDATAGDYFALVNGGADAGGVPGIDFAELHVGFGERDAFNRAHGRSEEHTSELQS